MAPAASSGFKTAQPGRAFQFPRDHGAHPDFKTEWWYYSGHLKAKSGETFGYQLTFFRVALARSDPEAKSAWAAPTIYFAHLALSDINGQKFIFREKAQRGALGLAGAEAGRLKVWVGDWQAEMRQEVHHLAATTDAVSLNLELAPLKPPVLHGQHGYSRKAAAAEVASHYYSITRLATKGQLAIDGKTLEVEGTSWLDREFSSGQMAPHHTGWDWFALQLADGTDIMLYLMRLKDGGLDPASSGTLIDPQGRAQHLNLSDFSIKSTRTWKSPHSGATYPSGWDITLPEHGFHLSLTPTLPDQELRTGGSANLIYWEGQVGIKGSKQGQPLAGQGYVELTGYAGSLGGRF
ncbi:MAG: lipocalin-like domain-containing protein [Deltaproteobacteria bacterium]|nr:lipocalin-like domain-containing protein [Deltaproteobacteria bacterium]